MIIINSVFLTQVVNSEWLKYTIQIKDDIYWKYSAVVRRERAKGWWWDLSKPSDDLPDQENNQYWTVNWQKGRSLYKTN